MTTNQRKRDLAESIFRSVLEQRLEEYNIRQDELEELAEICIKAVIVFEQTAQTLLGPRAEDYYLQEEE